VFSTPAVAGDAVFVGSCNGFLRAFDNKTGTLRWTYDTRQDGDALEFHGEPALTDELLIIGSDIRRDGHTGFAYAFERSTGKLRWKYPAGNGVMTDILRRGSTVYFVTVGDVLTALDLNTGDVRWTFASGFPNTGFIFNSSPALAGDRIFFGGLNGTVYALEADTGKAIWSRALGAMVTTPLALDGPDLYVGVRNSRLLRLDAGSGEVKAELALPARPVWKPVVAGDCVVIFLGVETMDTIACAEPSLARLRWTHKAEREFTSARPYLWHGLVLAGDYDTLRVLRLADGSLAWTANFTGMIRGIGATDEVLYVGTLKGIVYAYAPPSE